MTGPAPLSKCCFPGQETSFVTLKNDKRRIEDVEVGDEVKVITDQLEFRYSRVYALGHKNKDRKTMFIELGTASSRIPISPRHFIKIYDNGNIIEKFAKDVKICDCCFPGQETSFVTLKNDKRRIEDVEVGDEVKVITDQLEFRYSRVYALGHKNKDRKTMFIELGTASSRIPISPRHFIKIYDNGNIIEKFAKDVKIGDLVYVMRDGETATEAVLDTKTVYKAIEGESQILDGVIIVNNVLVSYKN
ncbi:hypothetical protein LOTGIDRAFT_155741 [Lottia gigantea]|uniref:Hint domain-containing protein n=1 Tax=Lottia gigantea TaxID=225164 RepID=V4B2M0_LOTGI|nr:hypothetical protein LOTGIDRAFT_155741 [Lottia gigantea]ESO82724.1 hypothetical protein LOTGIDRAFT_155741 [Lottia gigantea]